MKDTVKHPARRPTRTDSADRDSLALVETLHKSGVPARRMGLKSMKELGGKAVPVLVEAMHAPDGNVRRNAVDLLRRIGPDAAPALPELIDALDDPDWLTRMWAADALGHLGNPAKAAIPALTRASRDRSDYVRLSASLALTWLKAG